MAMKKIKSGDTVIILTGKDRGRSGKIIKMLPKDRALVEGINLVKKHVRPNPNTNTQGGIIEREAGIHLSNLALFNPMTKKADRIGFKEVGGKKVRYFKSNGEVVDA